MKCLNCGEKMTTHLVNKKGDYITFDICKSCGSLWLDKGELDKMAFQVQGSIEYSSERIAENTGEKIINCPRCENEQMQKVYFIGYSDIILDHCNNCGGFWLNAGELDQINKELESIMPVTGKGFSDFVKNVHQPIMEKNIEKSNDIIVEIDDIQLEAPPIKGSVKEGIAEFLCPVCKPDVKMDIYDLHSVKYEGCPECKGIFLDQGELRKLKDHSKENEWMELNWIDDEIDEIENSLKIDSHLFCPKCSDVKMVGGYYGKSNVVIEWCPGCKGLWLDRKEFRDITGYLEEKLINMPSGEMKEKLKQELKEVWNGPEPTWEEMKDAKSALSAFISINIFEHPTLFKILKGFSDTAHNIGIY